VAPASAYRAVSSELLDITRKDIALLVEDPEVPGLERLDQLCDVLDVGCDVVDVRRVVSSGRSPLS